MPKVSVLMSIYNKGEYLQQAIQSILDQSYTDFEFIIRDNHSTDNSIDVVAGFNDPRINFAKNSRNLGPGGSLNNCIGEAKGEYVTIAHGDDIWDKEFLATNLAFLENKPSINIAHSLMHVIDERDIVTYTHQEEGIGEYRIDGYEDVLKQLFKGCYVKTPTVFIRRTSLRYFEIRYMYTGDWDLYLNLAASHFDFVFINKPLIYYRVSNISETAVGMRGGDLVLEGCMTLRNFFNKYPEYSQYRRKALQRFSGSILRRSKDASGRESLSFFFCCAILCYPLQVFNPVFHFYLFMGVIFGPRGIRLLKRTKRKA